MGLGSKGRPAGGRARTTREHRVGELARVGIVIPTWNGREMLRECLLALRGQSFRAFRVVVVDGASTDGTREMLAREFPEVELRALPRNLGFARAANAGIRATREELVALLNNDAVPEPRWLEELVARADSAPEESAFASAMLRYDRPGEIDIAGLTIRADGTPVCLLRGEPESALPRSPVRVLGPCAGAGLYRRRLFDDVGLFDEGFGSYCEDVDLALRAALAGHRSVLVPSARVRHRHMGTFRRAPRLAAYLQYRNTVLYLLKNMPLAWLARRMPRFALSGLRLLVRPWRPDGWLYVLAKLELAARLPGAILGRLRAGRTRRLPFEHLAGLLMRAKAPATAPLPEGGPLGP